MSNAFVHAVSTQDIPPRPQCLVYEQTQPRLHLILNVNPHRAPNTRFIRRDHPDTLLFRQLIALSKRVPAPE